jgi:O-antigen ligase
MDASMQAKLLKIESAFLSLFPVLYCLIILPSKELHNTFFTSKINLLAVFVILATIFRFIASRDVNFAQFGDAAKKISGYLWVLSVFLLSLLVSVLLSPEQTQSIFGAVNFHTGASFILLSALAFWLYSSGQRISRVGPALLILIFNVLVVLEYLGFRPLAPITDAHTKLETVFPAVTVGYRGQVAGISILLSLLPLYWFRDRYSDWRFWMLFIVGCIGMGCTTNSSATIGFAVALLLFILVSRKTVLMVLLIPLLAIVNLNAYRPLTALNTQLYALGWVANKADSKDLKNTVTLKTRLILWEAGARMFVARPIFGWGPQTYNQHWFNYISKTKGDQLYRLELGLKPEQKLVRIGDSAAYKTMDGEKVPVVLNYTTPHSAVIDLLYSQGIVGFSLFCLFLITLVRYMRKRMGRVAFLALLPLIGYFIYLAAWFITVPATGLAAIILGMAVSDARNTPSEKIESKEVN